MGGRLGRHNQIPGQRPTPTLGTVDEDSLLTPLCFPRRWTNLAPLWPNDLVQNSATAAFSGYQDPIRHICASPCVVIFSPHSKGIELPNVENTSQPAVHPHSHLHLRLHLRLHLHLSDLRHVIKHESCPASYS